MSDCPHRVDPVVVSGVGVLSPFGDNESTWEGVREGRSAVGMQQVVGVDGFPSVPGAPCRGDSPVPFLKDRKLAKYMSPAASMAVIAAGRALKSAQLLDDEQAKAFMALFVATGLISFDLSAVRRAVETACSQDGELDLKQLGADGLRACHPLMPFKMLLNMSLGLVSIAFGLRGSNFVTYPDAVQSGVCFERALRGIRSGRFELALVGGTCQGFSLMPICSRLAEDSLATSVSEARPFAVGHIGVAPADAAAFIVLESRRSAQRRGIVPVAVVDSVAFGRSETQQPDLVVIAGTRDRTQDMHELLLGGDHVVNYDACWGDVGAASLPVAVGACVEMMRLHEVWPMPWRQADGRAPDELVVTDAHAADVRPRVCEVRASNGLGGRAIATLSACEQWS